MWMPVDLIDDKSTLLQVVSYCYEAASHYLKQCIPRSTSLYGVTRPEWVKWKTWCILRQLDTLFHQNNFHSWFINQNHSHPSFLKFPMHIPSDLKNLSLKNTLALTNWGRDKMATISQTTLSITFSSMRMLEFWLKFHWSLILRVQLSIFQHLFR